MGTVEGGGYEMENIEFRFNRIVVAIDGSAGAYRALQWAITLARRTGAEIVAVHVVDRRRHVRRRGQPPRSRSPG